MNKDIQVVVFDTRPMNGFLQTWLERFEHVWYTSKLFPNMYGGKDFLSVKRNRVIKKFLEETDLPWLLMLDDDIAPLDGLKGCPSTWPLIECRADVASAHFTAQMGNEAHGRPGDIALAPTKISRVALEKMGAPWSQFEFSEDGTEVVNCECDLLAAKAKAVGFYPVKAGVVGHAALACLVPDVDGKRGGVPSVCLLSHLQYETEDAKPQQQPAPRKTA